MSGYKAVEKELEGEFTLEINVGHFFGTRPGTVLSHVRKPSMPAVLCPCVGTALGPRTRGTHRWSRACQSGTRGRVTLLPAAPCVDWAPPRPGHCPLPSSSDGDSLSHRESSAHSTALQTPDPRTHAHRIGQRKSLS